MKAGFEERMAVDGEEISERRSFVVHAVSHIPEKAPPKVAAVSADANDAPLDVPTSVKKWDWSHQPSQRIVVKSVKGRKWNLLCPPETTGAAIMKHIGLERGVVAHHFICEGRDLLPKATLQEQGIVGPVMIHRIPLVDDYTPAKDPQAPPVRVLTIWVDNDQILTVPIAGTATISTLQSYIERSFPIPLGYTSRLFYKGVVLGADPLSPESTIEDYGIGDNHTVMLFISKAQDPALALQ